MEIQQGSRMIAVGLGVLELAAGLSLGWLAVTFSWTDATLLPMWGATACVVAVAVLMLRKGRWILGCSLIVSAITSAAVFTILSTGPEI